MNDPALYWLIIGLMLVFLQLAVPGHVLFFFGFGALVTSVVTWLYTFSLALQLVVLISTSIVFLLCFKKIIQNKSILPVPKEGGEEREEDADVLLAVAGEKGVVSSTIAPPAEGRIKYSGTFWRASADEKIEEGEIIAIVRRQGSVIHVEKV